MWILCDLCHSLHPYVFLGTDGHSSPFTIRERENMFTHTHQHSLSSDVSDAPPSSAEPPAQQALKSLNLLQTPSSSPSSPPPHQSSQSSSSLLNLKESIYCYHYIQLEAIVRDIILVLMETVRFISVVAQPLSTHRKNCLI